MRGRTKCSHGTHNATKIGVLCGNCPLTELVHVSDNSADSIL